MEVICTVTSYRQKSACRFFPQWNECDRADFDIVGAEKIIPLSITNFPAARRARLQERFEAADRRIISTDLPEKLALGSRRGRFIRKKYENGLVCAEATSQFFFDHVNDIITTFQFE